MKKQIIEQLLESADVKKQLADKYVDDIAKAADICVKAIKNGGKIMLCGNGGSAADSQHLATELVVRLSGEFNRQALPAIALTTDTSTLTACANDFGFDQVFSRQVEALGKSGDILIAISTSGNSANVIKAVETAKRQDMHTIGFAGKNKGRLSELADMTIAVPSDNVQRIQEAHITVGHIIISLIEREIFKA
jgi:D-sedoheptulose 7-phosphate isomerase